MNGTKSMARWTVLLIAMAVTGCGDSEEPGSEVPAVASGSPAGGTTASGPPARPKA